jgi:hypothetical protein
MVDKRVTRVTNVDISKIIEQAFEAGRASMKYEMAELARIIASAALSTDARAVALPAVVIAGKDKVKLGDVLPGMFLGMTIADAAKKLMAIERRPLTTPEVLEGLTLGGIVFRGKSPRNTLGSILHRQSRDETGIVSVARGKWGLKEYPNRS